MQHGSTARREPALDHLGSPVTSVAVRHARRLLQPWDVTLAGRTAYQARAACSPDGERPDGGRHAVPRGAPRRTAPGPRGSSSAPPGRRGRWGRIRRSTPVRGRPPRAGRPSGAARCGASGPAARRRAGPLLLRLALPVPAAARGEQRRPLGAGQARRPRRWTCVCRAGCASLVLGAVLGGTAALGIQLAALVYPPALLARSAYRLAFGLGLGGGALGPGRGVALRHHDLARRLLPLALPRWGALLAPRRALAGAGAARGERVHRLHRLRRGLQPRTASDDATRSPPDASAAAGAWPRVPTGALSLSLEGRRP